MEGLVIGVSGRNNRLIGFRQWFLWYKGEVVRACHSIVLSVAIFIAFVEAPFLHTHQHESTQRHAGPVFHLHLGLTHHSGKTPEFQGLNPDDDAQLQSWLSLTPTDSTPVVPAVPAEFYSIPDLKTSRLTVDAPSQTGHDPPGLSRQNPRAPPA